MHLPNKPWGETDLELPARPWAWLENRQDYFPEVREAVEQVFEQAQVEQSPGEQAMEQWAPTTQPPGLAEPAPPAVEPVQAAHTEPVQVETTQGEVQRFSLSGTHSQEQDRAGDRVAHGHAMPAATASAH